MSPPPKTRKPTGRPPKYPQLRDETWLKNHRGTSAETIAKELGCVPLTVIKAFARYGITPQESGAGVGAASPLQDVIDPLEGLYYIADMLRDITRHLARVQEQLATVDDHLSRLNADGDIESIRETLRKGFA